MEPSIDMSGISIEEQSLCSIDVSGTLDVSGALDTAFLVEASEPYVLTVSPPPSPIAEGCAQDLSAALVSTYFMDWNIIEAAVEPQLQAELEEMPPLSLQELEQAPLTEIAEPPLPTKEASPVKEPKRLLSSIKSWFSSLF